MKYLDDEYTETIFTVNGKTVTCVIRFTTSRIPFIDDISEDCFKRYTYDHATKTSISGLIEHIHKRYFKNPSYVGVTTCSDDDEFDIEKGKRIAYLKAINKMRSDDLQIRHDILMSIIHWEEEWFDKMLQVREKYQRLTDYDLLKDISKWG